MLTNFEQMGLGKYQIKCLFGYNTNESDWEEKVNTIKKVEAKFKKLAQFYYYQDTREFPISYISSIRPHILKKYFRDYPLMSNYRVFYHDCDMVFTKPPDFLDYVEEKDDNWYLSNTIDYIGANYILKSGGEHIYQKMCKIVGIHPSLVQSKQEQSGGAQYLVKGLDYWFWNKVELDCENMFREITQINALKKEQDPNHDFQIWCSDMWAVLWNGWMRGFNTYIIKELDFTWGVESIGKWDENYIYHNAGIEQKMKDTHFYKSEFMDKYPYFIEKKYSKEFASYKYYEIIKSIENKTCLL